MFFCFDDRPSVTTGGCSTRSSTSCEIAPEIRSLATLRCSSSASAYRICPSRTTHSSRAAASSFTTSPLSGVNDLAERIETGFSDRFGECRVRMDCEIDLLYGELVLASDSDFMQQLSRV